MITDYNYKYKHTATSLALMKDIAESILQIVQVQVQHHCHKAVPWWKYIISTSTLQQARALMKALPQAAPDHFLSCLFKPLIHKQEHCLHPTKQKKITAVPITDFPTTHFQKPQYWFFLANVHVVNFRHFFGFMCKTNCNEWVTQWPLGDIGGIVLLS